MRETAQMAAQPYARRRRQLDAEVPRVHRHPSLLPRPFLAQPQPRVPRQSLPALLGICHIRELMLANPTLIKRPVIETGADVYVGWTKDVQAVF